METPFLIAPQPGMEYKTSERLLYHLAEQGWKASAAGQCSATRTYGLAHVKFAASSMLPVPLYVATWGYGQSGRVRTTFSSSWRIAMIRSGAFPRSTQSMSGVIVSARSGPTPPAQ